MYKKELWRVFEGNVSFFERTSLETKIYSRISTWNFYRKSFKKIPHSSYLKSIKNEKNS